LLNAADSTLPKIFHIGAQANAPSGETIGRYTIAVDNHVVYENRMITPVQRLSIELNLKSSVSDGLHTVRVNVDGAGTAEVKGLRFLPSENASFCEPVGTFEMPICSPSNQRPPLTWVASEPAGAHEPFSRYLAGLNVYRENLESLEADVADAAAVDSHGNLYIALHSFADVELRKYAPNGSITYDSVIRSCGDGFISVAGLDVDDAGHAWIAGNTTACLAATPGALQTQIGDKSQLHGFVMMLDTSKPNATAPVYVTYTAGVENQIAAIRVDRQKNVYLAGVTSAAAYPHESVLRISGTTASAREKKMGFVSVLNSSGSRLLWSTLLQDAQPTALALDGAETVFVTGRVASPRLSSESRDRGNVLIAGIAGNGRRLSYAARLGQSSSEEGRAISITSDGQWLLIAGETHSRNGPAPVVAAIQPCKTGIVLSRSLTRDDAVPEIAVAPALDAYAAHFPLSLMHRTATARECTWPCGPRNRMKTRFPMNVESITWGASSTERPDINGAIDRTSARVQIAPACLAEAR
jgi:hypothetical protein